METRYFIREIGSTNERKKYMIQDKVSQSVLTTCLVEENAEFICSALNNYESVKSDNDRLREAMEKLLSASSEFRDMHGSYRCEAWMKAKSLLTPKP